MSMIYFVQETSPRTGALCGVAVKIGFVSQDIPGVRARLNGLRSGNPRELSVVAVVMGPKRLESALHERFRAWQIRGEWFLCQGELYELVSHYQLRDDGRPSPRSEQMPHWFVHPSRPRPRIDDEVPMIRVVAVD